MNLHAKLMEREAAGRPITIGLIGAGKFGTMFLAQVRRTPGMHVVGVADLDVARARAQLHAAGWGAAAYAWPPHAAALKPRGTHVGADAEALIACPGIEVIIEANGVPEAGIRHALAAIDHGRHIPRVNADTA